jgi:amino acid adenylation domain-containing protein
MVPGIFLPVHTMPFIAALKLDRRKLRQMAEELSPEQISALYPGASDDKAQVSTETEMKLRDIWAAHLGLAANVIGKNDGFLSIGGDSISAIRVVSAAQEQGVNITVADVFRDARLDRLAALADARQLPLHEYSAEPFSLLSAPAGALVREVVSQCGLDTEERVQDVFPTTPLQQGLMALTIKTPGAYVATHAFKLSPTVDIDRFKATWERLVAACTNLRTRMVTVNDQTYQAVIREDVTWVSRAAARDIEVGYGSPLNRFCLEKDAESGDLYFLWLAHHSIYDGWTVSLILAQVNQMYHSLEAPRLQPYSSFVSYVTCMDTQSAAEFWERQLSDANQAIFPAQNRSSGPITTRVVTEKMTASSPSDSITLASVLRAAWALVLARYNDTRDITFGATVSGRNAPVPGLAMTPGLVIATVPVRVKFDGQQRIHDYLSAVQNQATEMIAFEQFGLHNISKLSESIRDACDFSSLMVIQPLQKMGLGEDMDDKVLVPTQAAFHSIEDAVQGFFNYPLIMQCELAEDSTELTLIYDSSVLHDSQSQAIAQQFKHVVQQLTTYSSEDVLDSVSMSSDWDIRQASTLRGETPEMVSRCVHGVFEDQAALRPEAAAIDAWDGQFTYRQLDEAAGRLAYHLVHSCGVEVEDLVHVCFDKSAYYLVAILAINKAGAAFVPLDPSHPAAHKRGIVQQTRARLALVSESNVASCADLGLQVLEINAAFTQELAAATEADKALKIDISPSNAAYVLFTSGSTGKPKGFVMEHRAVCSSQANASRRMGITPNVRILHFASTVFDMSVVEIIFPLLSGACICIPSEYARLNELPDFVRSRNINWACFTPSFLRTLHPDQFPSLDLILLAGEAVTKDILDTWFGKVRLLNGWGPAETCCFASLHEFQSVDESPLTIGRPVSSFCWIADPDDGRRLAPIGVVGEVMIQGPALLREYLGDEDRTRDTILYDLPAWVTHREQTHWDRFYKSGDLCQFNPDGTLRFVGRKDTQVKVRGFRVELGDIESHVRAGLVDVAQVAVDTVEVRPGSKLLVAYLCFTNQSRVAGASLESVADMFTPLSSSLTEQLASLVGELKVKLPSYMIPSLFIPCQYMPFITSTKLARKILTAKTLSLSQPELAMYSLQDLDKRPPETDVERQMQTIWAQTLQLPVDSIGRDDSFLGIGGDSISAIHVMNAARSQGLSVTVRDIFRDPRLSAVAAAAKAVDTGHSWAADPFELLDDGQRQLIMDGSWRQACRVGSADGDVEDAYPLSPLQEGLIAIAEKLSQSYITKYVFKLNANVDLDRFKSSWEHVIQLCANLRTRIIRSGAGVFQVVLKEEPCWENTETMDLRAFISSARSYEMSYGTRLSRQALITEPDGQSYFCWVIHHSVIDGWSLKVAFDTMMSVYWNQPVADILDYSSFIKYIRAMDDQSARTYWLDQLGGAVRTTFPAPMQGSRPEYGILNKTIAMPPVKGSITHATVLRAAWSIVLARRGASEDISFGATVAGRNAPVDGLTNMAGPAIATVPVRVRINSKTTIQKFLRDVQLQASDMSAYEQYGLQNISKISTHAREACDFSSLLVIQPKQSLHNEIADGHRSLFSGGDEELKIMEEEMSHYFNYPLVLVAALRGDHIDIRFSHETTSLSTVEMEALSHQLDTVVKQLCVDTHKPLETVSLVGSWEAEHALRHTHLQPPTEACIHTLIEKHVKEQPHAPAIAAWDGHLTYADLGRHAYGLAHRLRHLGVGPETIVPFCFAKSAWAAVSMLAVAMAGGAFMPLDPEAPPARIRSLLETVNAKLVLAGPEFHDMMSGLSEAVLSIDELFLETLPAKAQAPDSGVTPANASFVIFTSGSTGKSKAMVHDHRSLCSAIAAYTEKMAYGPGMRVFTFSAYTFDWGIMDVMGPLSRGACICVPSDHQRLNSLAETINTLKAYSAFFTPTVAGLIDPVSVPLLKDIALGGEAITQQLADRWRGHANLHNFYGPSEATINGYQLVGAHHQNLNNIGTPMSSAWWAVDPEDMTQLVPIGCIGELLIQGPLLARGYVNADDKANAAWLHDVNWLPGQDPCKVYRTGDLVRRNADGTFDYIGRTGGSRARSPWAVPDGTRPCNGRPRGASAGPACATGLRACPRSCPRRSRSLPPRSAGATAGPSRPSIRGPGPSRPRPPT